VLQAPAFLYRVESANPADEAGIAWRSDRELATRLAFMLWDAPPDGELLRVAEQGRLHNVEVLAAQATRMLNAPEATEKLVDFHRQWLELRRYDAMHFQNLPEHIGVTMRREVELFVQAVVLDKPGSFSDLFTASFSFVNRDLAPLYDVEGDFGSELVRTELDSRQRAGLLTQTGFLTLTGGETAPIHRGVFINRKLLCTELPPPPMFQPGKLRGETRRERIESITGKGTCGEGCHARLINPAGYPFEVFDDLAHFRTEDNGQAIDDTGAYPVDGEEKTYAGPVAWSRLIAGSQQAHECYARRLLEYSFERSHAAEDAELIEQMAEASRVGHRSPRELLMLMVKSGSFLARRTESR
jgi:hypothetical protein